MKTITKLGLAVILFMATALFNSVMAQKLEFKANIAKRNAVWDARNKEEQVNAKFIIDLDKKSIIGLEDLSDMYKGSYSILSEIQIKSTRDKQTKTYQFNIGKEKWEFQVTITVNYSNNIDTIEISDNESFVDTISGKLIKTRLIK